MKFTHYFLETKKRSDRKNIKIEWIEMVFSNPVFEKVQEDGRIQKWGFVEETG